MQHDFVSPVVFAANQRAHAIVPKVQQLLIHARVQLWPVLHIVREYRADGSNIEHMRVQDFLERPRAVPGTPGCEIIPELTPLPGEFRVVKWRFSAFMSTELDFLLRRLGIKHLVIAGTQLPNCVRATVYDAMALDYAVTVIIDAVAARTQPVHEANIVDMQNLGVQCLSLADLVAV